MKKDKRPSTKIPLFFTGAGISASAGIPIYREEGSSWTEGDLEKKSHANRYGNHLDELWDRHWGPLSQAMEAAEPTYAHKAIAQFQHEHPSVIATQNIDLLHERAGSDEVFHLHGKMELKCLRCKHGGLDIEYDKGTPMCPNCGKNKTRPDVVLFGESLNKSMFNDLERYARLTTHLIVVGSSMYVQPAAGLAMICLKPHVKTILINKGQAQFEQFFDEVYHEEADLVIDEVLDSIRG